MALHAPIISRHHAHASAPPLPSSGATTSQLPAHIARFNTTTTASNASGSSADRSRTSSFSLSPSPSPFPTASLSRTASRRPSAIGNATSQLQSFFEGVGFAARCSDGLRRGESRSGSRQVTQAGRERGRADSSEHVCRSSSAASLPFSHTRSRTLAEEEEGFISDVDSATGAFERHHLGDSTVEGDGDEDFDVQVFEEGQRIAVGFAHEDEEIVDCFPATHCDVDRLEIVRKLGSGSYAVVYLAREVVSDPRDAEDADPLDNASSAGVVYGKEYALKCLSKRNLSDDLLEVQKFEATLHRALPLHPNIVSMYGAWETSSWLFLLLEYCPGQDLFYWLEQSKDHDNMDPLMHPSASFTTARAQQRKLREDHFSVIGPESHSATPPSPTLLSITAMSSLLSRRRLRLISRMFAQMCDAVAATHKVGISHRDIKPENFICCDDDAQSRGASERKVTVKLTDWGLGTSEEECGDFDCGSKPYMAYECRNNLAPSYRPREADIWSLGIVLLNLLFHRSPWSDPTLDDPDFAEYCASPVAFLEDRFSGIGRDVAVFLANNVLNCTGPRISASALSIWAFSLVKLMSEAGPSPRQASVSQAAIPLISSRPADLRRLSSVLSRANSAKPSPRASLLGQQFADMTAVASPTAITDDDVPRDLRVAVGDSANMQISPVNRTLTYGEMPEEANEESEDKHQAQAIAEDRQTDDNGEAEALAAKAKRRKRGARRGRTHGTAVNGDSHAEPRPHRHERKQKKLADEQERNVSQDLAAASQELARELSGHSRPSLLKVNTDTHLSRSSNPTDRKAGASAGGFMGKFKGALKNGNPDLEAFIQNARARDAQRYGETYSAPGMMQPHLIGGSGSQAGLSSFDSIATRSSNSSWSAEGDSHWASTSSRRQRVGRHTHPHNTMNSSPTLPHGHVPSPSRYSSMSSSSEFSPSSISSGPSKLSSYRSVTSSRFSATSYSSETSPDSATSTNNCNTVKGLPSALASIDEQPLARGVPAMPLPSAAASPQRPMLTPSSVGSTTTVKQTPSNTSINTGLPSPQPEKKFSIKGLFRHQS